MDKAEVVHIYNGILLNHKKERMPFAATWMDLEIIILSEVSQKEKDIYYMISLICGISNMTQINISTKQKQTHRHRGQLWLPRGRESGGRNGVGVSRCKLVYIEWINNKVLLYRTGNYIQYPVINHNGKEYKKECMYMYN